MESDSNKSTKRVAKNTLMLYFRMIVVTLLSLITVKYTLKILGVEDYGIYNVVGGVVALFSFISATLNSATQRFLAFDLGKKDAKSYNNTFNLLLLIFGCLGIIIFIIFAALGNIIIYHWLDIPRNSLDQAYIVYQLSVITFVLQIIVIPFSASIIANEKMGVFAYITIAEAVSKLVVLGVLLVSPYNKLISYAVVMLLTSCVINALYVWYCQCRLRQTRLYLYWETARFKEIGGYTNWSIIGALSGVLCNQGMTVLMNLSFGVTVNAAKAISDRIKYIVSSFVQNFYIAISPQIVKTYAAGEEKYTSFLAFRSTRLSYYLMFVISVPLIMLMKEILELWLTDTCTQDMVIFTQLSLVFAMANVFEAPITFMSRATGHIKNYQIFVGLFTLLVVPVSYVVYKLGYPAYAGFIVEIVIYSIVQYIRVLIVKPYYSFTLGEYFRDVILQPIILSVLTIIVAIGLYFVIGNNYVVTAITTTFFIGWIWFFGLNSDEKTYIANFIKKKFAK